MKYRLACCLSLMLLASLPLYSVARKSDTQTQQNQSPIFNPPSTAPLEAPVKKTPVHQLPTPATTSPVPAGPTDAQLLQQAIESFFESVRAFDFSKAYYADTSREFRQTTNLDIFKLYIKRFPTLFRNQSFKVSKTTFNGNVGTIEGVLISTDGEEMKAEFTLVEEGDQWKVHAIKLNKLSQLPPTQSY